MECSEEVITIVLPARVGGACLLRMSHRFEFDPVNKILLLRLDGRQTDESLAGCYRAIREYSAATDASAGIWDFSSITEFAVSTEFIRQLARQEPAMPNATMRPRILVIPRTAVFGLGRMFQILGEQSRPLLQVVRTMDEAFAALRVPPPHFEPLE
jgi:hypothetical protein